VGCERNLDGTKTFDQCKKCNGDGSTCEPKTFSFYEELNLPDNSTSACPDGNDENDTDCGERVKAFEIPSGATALLISQDDASRNLICTF